MADLILGAVYYLESRNQNMNPIAIRPEVTSPNYMAWWDTSNGRIIRASKILLDGNEINLQNPPVNLDPPEKIELISESGEKFELVRLTNQIFNEKLRDIVAGGKYLHFETDQELQDYYLTTDFYTLGG